jgi:hypothetical protein
MRGVRILGYCFAVAFVINMAATAAPSSAACYARGDRPQNWRFTGWHTENGVKTCGPGENAESRGDFCSDTPPEVGRNGEPCGPDKPSSAVTGVASAITTVSATLNATVSPEGGVVSSCVFEYGTTEAYGATAMCSSFPPELRLGAEPVSAHITGLTPGTNYHFRIVATNEGGTGTGNDGEFTTGTGSPEPAHYFSNGLGNGARIAAGERVPTIAWGSLSLTNLTTGGKVSCHTVIGSVVENPAPGGEAGPAGIGETQSDNLYECESEACTAAATGGGPATFISVFAEGSEAPFPGTGTGTMTSHGGETSGEEPLVASGDNLKWKTVLIKEGNTVRQETEKAKVNVICHVMTAVNAKGEAEFGAQVPEVSKGNINPRAITHCCSRGVPGELEFDAGGVMILNEQEQRGKTEGKLKTLGYLAQEIINAVAG